MTSHLESSQPRHLRIALWNTIKQNWHLGVTSFGGPPVHFKIVSVNWQLQISIYCNTLVDC